LRKFSELREDDAASWSSVDRMLSC
jgi:hypothetical protein